MKKYVALVLVLLLCLSGCFLLPKRARLTKLLYKGVSVIPTTSQDYSYAANDASGNTVFYDYQNNQIGRSLSRDSSGNWLGVEFDEERLPSEVHTQTHIVNIENIEENQADFAVINNQTEEMNVYRDLSFVLEQPEARPISTYADAMRYVALCYLALAQVLDDIGVVQGQDSPAYLALAGTNSINTAMAEYTPEDFTRVEASCEAFVLGTMALGYAEEQAANCLELAVQAQQTINANEEAKQLYIQSTQGILENGYGDIQINLTWDQICDVDLHVTDPNGEEIYYAHDRSGSGGWLDVDNTHGYGPENVFWNRGEAPGGEYLIEVNYYAGQPRTNYIVTVIMGTSVQVYKGNLSNHETQQICRRSFHRNV